MGKAEKLSTEERERIARRLFTVKEHLASKSELHGLCPFHEDSNPSFGYNYGKDRYNCFTCGASGDLIKMWSHVEGSGNLTDDFKSFCRMFNIPLHADPDRGDRGPERRPEKTAAPDKTDDGEACHNIPAAELARAWAKMETMPATWRKRFLEVRGWTEAAIDRLDLRIQTCRWDKTQGVIVDIRNPDRVAIPVFDTAGVLQNIRCYKPGAGAMKIFSFGPGCGSARLFPAKPDLNTGAVLIVEGEADAICAISNGLNAITQTSKTKYWSDDHKTPFANRDVIIAYDADQPGQKYAKYAATSLLKIARTVRLLTWPDYMGKLSDGTWPADHGEDLTDFFVKHKKSVMDLKHLLDDAKLFTAEDAGPQCNCMEFFEHGPNGRLSFKPRLLADRICREFSLMTDPESSLIYRWNGICFEKFQEDHIEKACIEYLGDEAQQSRARDATFQAKRLSVIPFGRNLNDKTDWVCLQNGMLNLRTLEIRTHDKEFYATYRLPVTFDPDRPAKCQRFLQYLTETIQTEGPILQVQEFAGYCLTRDVRFEKALLLLGPGADGKSKLLSLLRALVGPENCAAVSFQDLEDQFHRSSLFDKLLNISTEVGSRAMESSYFKAIVSGDPISAAFKHQDAFEFRPFCKLVFAGNRMPRILDNSDGPFRRLLPISFKRQFLEDGDPFLEDKLMSELSEIFHWALVGLHRLWEQKGFTDCQETRQLLMEHRRSNNPVLCFVEDECVLGDDYTAQRDDLYKNYRKYSDTNGYKILGKENFFRELYAAVANLKQYRPQMDDGTRPRYISGIGLLTVPENG